MEHWIISRISMAMTPFGSSQELGADALKGIKGIENVNNFGKLQEIRLEEGVDPQKILAELLKKTRISTFEIAKPSLNDIFIRIASPERKEAGNA